MCSWFCPLAADWGNWSEVAQAVAGFLAVLVVQKVWREQSKLTRDLQAAQAEEALKMHTAQLDESRNLQKNSLRPFLTVKLHKKLTSDQVGFYFEVSNVGLGPAIVASAKAWLGEQEIHATDANLGQEVIREATSILEVDGIHQTVFAPDEGDWIPPGTTLVFAGGELLPTNSTAQVEILRANNGRELWNRLIQIRLVISYKSVFGDEWTATAGEKRQV